VIAGVDQGGDGQPAAGGLSREDDALIADSPAAARCDVHGQPLWASIGYALPALLGACLARSRRRGILLLGDGAAQMTIQELSTALRSRIPAVVIVVDNDGYTVERAIHGPTQLYNDVARWDWTSAPALFGAGCDWAAVCVTTVGELDQALAAASASKLTLIQAVVPYGRARTAGNDRQGSQQRQRPAGELGRFTALMLS
jgi:TPP-dependent 2-oxoacid decarboxylase